MGTRGTMIVEGEKEILLYKEVDRNTWKPGDAAPKTTTVTVENQGRRQAGGRGQPQRRGPLGRLVSYGTARHGRPLARLSRGTRALRLLHPPRQRLELSTTSPTRTSPAAGARSPWPTP